MQQAEELHQILCHYAPGRMLDFKGICHRYRVTAIKAPLPPTLRGITVGRRDRRLIVMSSAISYQERRCWSWHELYHALLSPLNLHHTLHHKECQKADLFAALCQIPHAFERDDPRTLAQVYRVPLELAQLRLKRLGGWGGRIPKRMNRALVDHIRLLPAR